MRPPCFTLILPVVFALMLSSCLSNQKEDGGGTADVIVKRATRKAKKGRVVEKLKVVDIPLTAEDNNLRGMVHTVRYRSYSYKGAKKLSDSGYNVYNRSGYLTEQNAYDRKGNRKWKCIYTYATDGKLKQWILNITNRGEFDTTTFQYDKMGNRIRSVTRANDSSRSGRKEYTFDKNGNETEVVTYNVKGRVSTIVRSKYDNRSNQIVYSELFPDGSTYMGNAAEYDAYGELTGLTFYVGESITGKTLMTNDEKGKHIEMTLYNASNEYAAKSVYTYDTMGNMLSRSTYGPDEKLQARSKEYTYKYDKAGNILVLTEYTVDNGKRTPLFAIVNEYTYY